MTMQDTTPQSTGPFDLGEFWRRNKGPFLVLLVIGCIAVFISPHLKKWDEEKAAWRAERRATMEQFVNTNLGTIQVVDGYWDNGTQYGANISIDVSKPMVFVKCEGPGNGNDKCWVVKKVQ